MLCGIYSRVSKEQGQEVENQLLQLREFEKSSGWKNFREYVDHETGSIADRTAFKQMLEDAHRKKFDVLLFWSLDRLTREGTLPTLKYLERLSNYGVAFHSYSEPYLDSLGPWKEMVIAVLATIAKLERTRISERTKAGLARVKARGVKLGRPVVSVDASLIGKRRRSGVSWRAIARELGVSVGTCKKALL